MGEHKAVLNKIEGPFKRQRVSDGISLILAKESKEPYQYTFDDAKYSPEESKQWLDKVGLDYMEFKESEVKARLFMKSSMKAANGMPEIDGRIWSAGIHHVFVNDKPARVYVPEETIMDTFKSVRGLIEDQGRMPIGIDHLSDSVIEENDILKKMNLLDVGSVTKVGTDGRSIYILDSELTNDSIKSLNAQGEIPAYSIVGAMDARPCPSGKADYIVKSIDVERVDFVEEGGCQVCKVGAQPDELILTSKSSKEELNMVEANDAPVDKAVEEEVSKDAPVEEAVEEKPEVKEEEVEEEEPEVEVEVEEEPDVVAELKKELAELKDEIKNLGGKKPKVEAKDAEKAVSDLIKAGKALPKMKAGLVATYEADPEAFEKLAASMPKMVMMETKAKLAKVKKEEREAKEAQDAELAEKEMAERYFGVKL